MSDNITTAGIRVYTRNWRGQITLAYIYLTFFIDEGKAFATWKTGAVRVRTSLRIPVSDELALQVSGAVRVPCPHIGEYPKYSMLGTAEYGVREKSSGEDCNSIEYCQVCGLFNVYGGNPRFRAFVTDNHEPGKGTHPERTYLKATSTSDELIYQADWDPSTQMLVPATEGQSLTLWTSRLTGLSEKFIDLLPLGASIAVQTPAYTMFRDHGSQLKTRI